MNALQIQIALLLTGAATVQANLNQTGQAASDLNENLDDLGDNDGLDNVSEGANAASSALEQATEKAGAFKEQMEGVRNKALAVGAIGAAGLALSSSMIEAGSETANTNAALESLLKKQNRLQDMGTIMAEIGKTRDLGHFEGTGELQTATLHLARAQIATKDLTTLMPYLARAARTSGAEMEEMADTLGESFKGLDLGGLEEMGLFFSEADVAAVEAAKGISEAAGQQKFLELFTREADKAFVGLEDSITGAQAAANDYHNAVNTAMSNTGAGAADARAHVQRLGASVLGVVNEASGLQYGAGYIWELGSEAASAIGGLVAFGAQALASAANLRIMQLASLQSAAAAGTAGAASVAGGAGAAAGSVGFLALAGSIWAVCAPLLVFIAIAAAAALAMKGLDYWLHKDEDEQLSKNIEAGNATNQARLDIANKDRQRKGLSAITVEQWQAMEAGDGDDTVLTPEMATAAKKNPTWNSGGSGSGSPTDTGSMPDYNALKGMLDGSKPGAAVVPAAVAPAQAAPVVAPMPAPSTSSVEAPSSAALTSAALKDTPKSAAKSATQTETRAASSIGTGKSGPNDEYAALRKYLEDGGDVNQYKSDKDGKGTKGDGLKAGAAGATSSGPLRVQVPPPKQTPLGNGKIRLEFAPFEIENPLERHLEAYS